MPVLSVYFGCSDISFLLVNNPKEFKFYKYPYVFSHDMFGNYVSEGDYYRQLFSRVATELKIPDFFAKGSKYKFVFTGFPNIPDIVPADYVITLDKLISQTTEYGCVFVNNYTVINSESFLSAYPVAKNYSLGTKEESSTFANYYANLSIFPQSSIKYDSDRLANDNFIRFLAVNSGLHQKKDQSVLFCGDRFSNDSKYEPLTYLLMVDLIKEKGIFDLKVDLDNIFPVLAALNSYSELYKSLYLDQNYSSLGTLINAEGNLECLIEKDTGPSQFVDVKPNELFLIPLEENNSVTIKVKNGSLGNIERRIKGGKIGLVIDTRSKSNNKTFNERYVEKNERLWEERIKEVLSVAS